jgi:crotonobetainyl-CoA:carnitine CoA-transferase CaiB-like acyl-CoA transferase
MRSEATYSGIRVLDLTKNVAGPFATMILADLGADVIKVEDPVRGDDTRHFAPNWNDVSVSFLSLNRNKRSIALDLKSAEDRAATLALASTADVVVESFRPGVVERLGLDFDSVKRCSPKVVYASVAAFGRGELGAVLPGYDPLLQAFAGIMQSTGHPDSPPTRVSASLVDLTTGMWTAMSVMAALARRQGRAELEAEYLEITLVDSAFNLMCHQVLGVLATGESPPRCGSGSPLSAPYEVFRTLDGEVMIAAGNDGLFKRLCSALGVSELVDDPRFAAVTKRVENRQKLHDRLEGITVEKSSEHWLTRLSEAGVPVGPVQDLKQAIAHPIVAERELLLDVQGDEDSQVPGLQLLRLPIGDVSGPRREPPTLGQHTDEILHEIGFSVSERAE